MLALRKILSLNSPRNITLALILNHIASTNQNQGFMSRDFPPYFLPVGPTLNILIYSSLAFLVEVITILLSQFVTCDIYDVSKMRRHVTQIFQNF